jgi:hypothetical protein
MLSKQQLYPLISLGKAFKHSSPELETICRRAEMANHWFSQDQIRYALTSWSHLLTEENLTKWLDKYSYSKRNTTQKKVGLITAGNIPLVGLHDLISILLSGHKTLVKLSTDDSVLMQFCINYMFNNGLPEHSIEVVSRLENFDAVIATGSNNTNRYFEYYFAKVPHLLRKNRTSIAVLTGNETKEQLNGLGEDIFRYYGLGCRNVAKLYIPKGYNPATFFEAIFDYGFLMEHNKYMNNHDYYRAIYLLNQEQFLDNNFVILKKEKQLHSPISIVYYEEYEQLEEVALQINQIRNNLQCVVGQTGKISGEIPFGTTQQPALWDYADGVDTMEFLRSI